MFILPRNLFIWNIKEKSCCVISTACNTRNKMTKKTTKIPGPWCLNNIANFVMRIKFNWLCWCSAPSSAKSKLLVHILWGGKYFQSVCCVEYLTWIRVIARCPTQSGSLPMHLDFYLLLPTAGSNSSFNYSVVLSEVENHITLIKST
jgi:hypothetical protein